MKDHVIVPTTIVKIEEKFVEYNHRKGPLGHECDKASIGWFVQFDGSTESIKLWDSDPGWRVGDKVDILFQRKPK